MACVEGRATLFISIQYIVILIVNDTSIEYRQRVSFKVLHRFKVL